MGFCAVLEGFKPHLFLILSNLCYAVLLVLLQSIISSGVSGPFFVVYEHIISTILLSLLAYFLERGRRPPLTVKIFFWAFLLGFILSMSVTLLTSSLRYFEATSQTVVLNTSTPLTFIIAVIFRRETFRFTTIEGQAKVWGVILSTIGTTVMVVWKGPQLINVRLVFNDSALVDLKELIGYLMLVIAILGAAGSSLLLEHAAITYHADLSLIALMGVCGTVSIAIVATLIERDVSAWKISWDELGTMIYGGVMIMGVASYVTIWCTRIKGPVFVSAFSPLLIVFSFLIETFILRKAAHLGSIVGAILVVIGLYFLLWAKANERRKDKKEDGSLESLLNDPHQPLIEQQD